jgi:hypothetical protein
MIIAYFRFSPIGLLGRSKHHLSPVWISESDDHIVGYVRRDTEGLQLAQKLLLILRIEADCHRKVERSSARTRRRSQKAVRDGTRRLGTGQGPSEHRVGSGSIRAQRFAGTGRHRPHRIHRKRGDAESAPSAQHLDQASTKINCTRQGGVRQTF